jgi:murein DD-endopeptidase MepM/ murein hydrolase activator NlpD
MSRRLSPRRFLVVPGLLLLFAVGVGAALADSTLPTTTTLATTTTETTTVATTTLATTASTTSATTTVDTTTTIPPASTTQSSTAPTTPTPPKLIPASAARELSLARGCPVAGLLLLLPHRSPLAIGPVANDAVVTQSGGVVYRAGGSLARASSATVRAGACAPGRARTSAVLRSVSLFGGTVTAARVALEPGAASTASFVRLMVDGKAIVASTSRRFPLASWGTLLVDPAKPVETAAGSRATAALAVHVLRSHDGLPAGAWLLVAAAAVPPPAPAPAKTRTPSRRKASKPSIIGANGQPLKVTPRLANRHYIFPVAGPSDYIDTYGAFRTDVPGNWHHGDDIFAALGTPVVAVASGTINRVGWEKLGGWRLWVRDGAGDEFYYAHLSGYAPADLRSNRVKAGQVIGFVGNTGDAFTTSPHLHFEVHPRQLLRLQYNGAVDPTSYLDGWKHLEHVDVPRPTHPPLPRQPTLRKEATYVFRELLAARHLIKHAPKASHRPHVSVPAGANGPPLTPHLEKAAPITASRPAKPVLSTVDFGLIVGLITLTLAAAIVLLPRHAPSRRLFGRLVRPGGRR